MQEYDPGHGRPGQLLESLFHSLSPDVFAEAVFDKYLVPALNSLPSDQRYNLCRLFDQALEDTRMIRKVHYYESSDILHMLYNDLDMDCKINSGVNGVEVQGAYMKEMVQVIRDWLQDLWQVCVEGGPEPRHVHNALVLCMHMCTRASAVKCLVRWTDYSKGPIRIETSNKVVVFSEERISIKQGILWVWRELLLYAIAARNNAQVDSIIDDLRRAGWLAEVKKLIPRGRETHNSSGYSFHRDHWSPEVCAAVSNLRQRIA